MRNITSHKIDKLNECLVVRALDDPGSGNPPFSYEIHADESKVMLPEGVTVTTHIQFNIGPFLENSVPNGISTESLLAVVIDRLEHSQKSRESREALTKLQEAMHWLGHRTTS